MPVEDPDPARRPGAPAGEIEIRERLAAYLRVRAAQQEHDSLIVPGVSLSPINEMVAHAPSDLQWLLNENAALRLAGATAQQQLEEKIAECGLWKEAAYKKIRTWEALQGMAKGGDSVESLAKNYDVPVEWVRFVLFPENDLDARYGRPSDRTKTAKAQHLEAEVAWLSEHEDHGKEIARRQQVEADRESPDRPPAAVRAAVASTSQGRALPEVHP